MRRLTLHALTADAFAPFGEVIDSAVRCESYPINEGRTTRHHALAGVDCDSQGGKAVLSLFRATPIDASFVLRSVERHPLGTQAFVNTSGNRYAIVVAAPGDFDESGLHAFLASPQQSINYHRGTWHHYLLALDGDSDFVVVDRDGPGSNCDELTLKDPLGLALAS